MAARKKRRKPDYRPVYRLMDAAASDPEKAKRLLAKNPGLIRARTSFGETALHYLVVEDCEDAVRFLIEAGAEVDTRHDFGDTPLLDAAGLNYAGMVKLLLERGADPNVRDANENTVLHHAADSGTEKTLSLLLAAGVNVNSRNGFGETPLLLAAGADVDSGNDLGETPPVGVPGRGCAAAVKLLLEHGADPNIGEWGSTPMHRAAMAGSEEILHLLLAAGADVRAKGSNDNSVLYYVPPKKRKKLLSILKEHGFDENS